MLSFIKNTFKNFKQQIFTVLFSSLKQLHFLIIKTFEVIFVASIMHQIVQNVHLFDSRKCIEPHLQDNLKEIESSVQ